MVETNTHSFSNGKEKNITSHNLNSKNHLFNSCLNFKLSESVATCYWRNLICSNIMN